MTVDYADYNTPQAHATAIAATGVGLLKFANQIAQGTGTTVAGGALATLASLVAVTQPSWEYGAALSLPAASGTAPFSRLILNWFDPTGTQQLAQDIFEAPSGNGPANAISITGRGPCKGEKLTAQLRNVDPAQTLTLTYLLQQTSHVFTLPQWEQVAPPGTAPNGFTGSGGDYGISMPVNMAATIAASSSITRLLGTRFGKWRFLVDNTGQANAVRVQIQTIVGFAIPAGTNIADVTVANAAVSSFEVSMPSSPAVIVLTNNGTTGSITPVVTAVFEPY